MGSSLFFVQRTKYGILSVEFLKIFSGPDPCLTS